MTSEIQTKLGAWLASGSPIVAELAASTGPFWVLLDMEHGYLNEPDILPNLMAFSGSDAQAIVRVPSHEPSLIGRILDRGSHGIMAPHVDTAEQARQLVRATRYAPDGDRGFARSTRSFRFGLQKIAVNHPPRVFAQIESAQGVGNASAIAAIDGIDVLFVGPADLKHDLSADGKDPELKFRQPIKQVRDAARKHGKELGTFLRNPAEAKEMAAMGFSWIAIDSDLGILRAGFQKNATIDPEK